MNNEINVDKLFDIAYDMKSANDNRIAYKKLIANNPSHGARSEYEKFKEEYVKALNDFDYFVQNYVKYKEKEEN